MLNKKDGYLVEVSWEVCNKVGGIYTVVSSKAPYIRPEIENYLCVGPYFNQHNSHDFIEEAVPSELREVFSEMKERGMPCRYGKWLIKSDPKVILIDFSHVMQQKNDVKGKLWELYQVDSLNAGFDFDEPVTFSVAAAQLIETIQRRTKKQVVAQFHEWMTGAGILWLKHVKAKVGTIFTTHATVLGRSLVGGNSNFYSTLNSVIPEKEAREKGVLAKHHMEKMSAQKADVFTTVSEITGMEAEHLLGRKPDVLLPNGIDLDDFATFEELSIRHSELKHQIKDFIMSFFFPYYSFELDDTLIFFTIGRYEFANKGIDIYIEALGRLNEQLKIEKSNKTVVSFFFIPADTSGIHNEVLENKMQFFDIKSFIEKEKPRILDKVIYLSVAGEQAKKQNILDSYSSDILSKKVLHFKRKGNPGYATHDLRHFDNDAIIQGFKRAGLNNDKEDKVKVIFYPAYLKSTDNLLNLDVYDAILGGHLGVFDSAYEPWGYTPLESAALGVASITSDLSGFGRYLQKDLKKDNPGVFVLNRFKKSHEEMNEQLYQTIKYYTSLDKEGRIQNKIEARRLAGLADWKKLIKNYFEAYNLASERVK